MRPPCRPSAMNSRRRGESKVDNREGRPCRRTRVPGLQVVLGLLLLIWTLKKSYWGRLRGLVMTNLTRMMRKTRYPDSPLLREEGKLSNLPREVDQRPNESSMRMSLMMSALKQMNSSPTQMQPMDSSRKMRMTCWLMSLKRTRSLSMGSEVPEGRARQTERSEDDHLAQEDLREVVLP